MKFMIWFDKYGQAALRCKKAGFDLVEVHGAGGCLPTNSYHQMIIKGMICMGDLYIIV